MKRVAGGAALAAAILVTSGPVSAQSGPSGPSGGAGEPLELVFNGEDNRLNVYDAETGEKITLIENATDDPERGLDINAEICFVPDSAPWKPPGQIWFIAGEDTEQNSEPGVIKQGWGFFRLTGNTLDGLRAEQVGKLVPDSFVTSADNPENYGCGVLPDGRVVTSDVGDQFPQDPATGQLIVWYPAPEHFGPSTGPARNDFPRVPHCKIDTAIGTAGGIAVDGTDVYVASNRPAFETASPGGIYRYDSTVWPDGETADDGCGREDQDGEQLADADKVGKELFIPQLPGILTTPSDIVDSGRDTFYVSSVISGQVAEFTRDGLFVRHVFNSTGIAGGDTPFGIGVTSDGTLWIADIGARDPEPAEDEGSIIRLPIDLETGDVGEPERIDEGLQYPDGIGVVVLRGGPPSEPSGPSTAGGTRGVPAEPTATAVAGAGAERAGGVLARTGADATTGLAALLALGAALALRRSLSRQ